MMTKLKRKPLPPLSLLSHTKCLSEGSETLLSDDEKLELFKQIFRSIKQALPTDHVKEEGLWNS